MLFLMVILASCEKVLDPEQEESQYFDPSVSVKRTVSIDASAIGGNGLKLISARWNDAPLVNGAFNTAVSKEGVQLLSILDSENKIRALTLSNPSSENFEVMPVDVQSTALSLIFISPGILSTDPVEAGEIIDNVQSLMSFIKLKRYLSSNLPVKSLDEIVQLDEYNTLLSACVEEFGGKKPDDTAEKGISDWKNDFRVNQYSRKLEFKNRAFRYVKVTQIDKSESNSTLRTSTLSEGMKGAIPLSWGSIFTLSYMSPTVKTVDFTPNSNSAYSEIWVTGMGVKNSDLVPPSSVAGLGTQDVETMLFYILFPVIDLVTGSSSLLGMPETELHKLANLLKNTSAAISLYNADNFTTICRELVNFGARMCKEILKNPDAVKAISSKLGATVVKEASTFLSAAKAIMGAGNVTLFATNICLVERYTKFIVYTRPPSFAFLSSPKNNAVGVGSPVTLKWAEIMFADTYELQVSKYDNFSVNVFTSTGFAATKQVVNNLTRGTRYYWRVRAKNGFGYSPWSEVWSFTI